MKPILLTTFSILTLVMTAMADHKPGEKVLVLKNKKGAAMLGYDAVAYFTENKAVKGKPRIHSEYGGARYHFASSANKALFDANPAKYAPAYGGYCGYAASIGKVRPANPLLWSIVDGQLVLQHTKGAVKLWEKDVAGNKTKADSLWPRLVEAKAGKKDPVDRLFGKSVLADVR